MTARTKTVLLTAGLALAAVPVSLLGPRSRVLTPPGAPGALAFILGLAGLFAVAEACLLHVEIRSETYSVTLTGLPLTLGLLYGTTREVVLARVIGSAAVLLVQRMPATKAAFNVAMYGMEAAVGVTLAHSVLDADQARLTMATAVICYAIITTADQAMSLLVIRIISWHQGRLSNAQVLSILVPALAWTFMTTTAALGAVELADDGTIGFVVVGVFAVAASLGYRGYQVLHRRHLALEHLHTFVGLTDPTQNDGELTTRLLTQIRDLMRAEQVETQIADRDPADPLGRIRLQLGHDGRMVIDRIPGRENDQLVSYAMSQAEGLLLRKSTRDPRFRAWLGGRRAQDAVIVPLPGTDQEGALMVLSRLGDSGSFTREDQTLLHTLAGHLAVAVNNARLLERLRYDATHDGLTGLANRVLLNQALATALAGPAAETTAVLVLDLDGFKEVNDSLGHHVGDALLIAVAERLQQVLPASSMVARLGGDEFAALLTDLEDVDCDALLLAQAVTEAVAEPVSLAEATIHTSASVGVALGGDDATDGALMRRADAAMYAAKDHGIPLVLYTPELDQARLERLALTADLRAALHGDAGELFPLYQPKLDLQSGRITSVETLVRWQHPRLGLVSPDIFVPLAEATGLIEELTHLVLRQALVQCAAWRADGLDLSVAVNLSARSVSNPHLPELVSDMLLAAGVPASRLVLEITESSLVHDFERVVPILTRVAAIGVTLSLDDFGTGYSSLSYLHRLPVAEIKIDRSFVSGLTAERRGAVSSGEVLVRTVTGLGANLGMRVVAEGVEDLQTLDLLRSIGCDLAQGFYISRPTDPDSVARMVSAPPTILSRRPRLTAVVG